MLTFETAALADAVSKAARVAPTKGAAFDKTAGIIIEHRPLEAVPVLVKATDMEVTYLEEMVPLSAEGNAFMWRIPSALLAGIVTNLPLGTTTKLEDKDGILHITCGKSKAKVRMYADVLIKFEGFDPTNLINVPGFAARVAQVSWATDKNAIPFTGVHIDGQRLVATDRYRLATVPLEVPVDDPITVPLEVLTTVAKNVTDARLAAVGKRLHVMPDDHIQITAVIYDAKYPNVERAMFREYDQSCVIDREELRNAINRMLVLVKGERYPIMKLTIGHNRIHVVIDVEDVGEMEDEVSVEGSDHDDHVIYFTPNNFVDGLSHAAKPTVQLSYDTTNPNRNVLFDDGDGYECWIVPRRAGDTDAGEAA